jgi:hypothetical protein
MAHGLFPIAGVARKTQRFFAIFLPCLTNVFRARLEFGRG